MHSNNSLLYRHRKLILVIFILMWIGAFTATHVPYNTIPRVFRDLGHFTLHVLGFLGLSSWFILTLAAFNFSPLRRIVVVLLIMTIYGAIDEYTQQFFGRNTSFTEWLIDTGATIVALVIWENIFWLTKRVYSHKVPIEGKHSYTSYVGSVWWVFEIIQKGGLMVEMNILQYGETVIRCSD